MVEALRSVYNDNSPAENDDTIENVDNQVE